MKVLYAIQGTGNGHLSRARDIVPLLQKMIRLDILVSGVQADLGLPFEVKYRLTGLSFIFGKNGGVDILSTYKKSNSKRLWREIGSLDLRGYDLVINDFEPVSAWAARRQRIPCIGLSHQAAVIGPNAPKPRRSDLLGRSVLRNYAPNELAYGFHFDKYDERTYTPVIRRQIREMKVESRGHYTVYLPAYDDKKVIKRLSTFKDVRWEVFSKHAKQDIRQGNVLVQRVNNDQFIRSMATSEGVLCGAGFETPAEALYMGKKLLVIPMKSQYEQQCNAAALKAKGVAVIKNLKAKRLPTIEAWINQNSRVEVNYPDTTQAILEHVLDDQFAGNRSSHWPGPALPNPLIP